MLAEQLQQVGLATQTIGGGNSPNLLCLGDNLEVMHRLLPVYRSKVRAIYIDPPYNTGSMLGDPFERENGKRYHDSLSHDHWLKMMAERLVVMRDFLTDNGSLWISIDDNECHYLKVLCDEIFGRNNFVNCVVVKMSHLSGVKMRHRSKTIPKIKEYLLCYAKKRSHLTLHEVYEPTSWQDALSRYNRFVVGREKELNQWRVITARQAAVVAGVNPADHRAMERFLIANANAIFRTARNRSLVPINIANQFVIGRSKSGKEYLVYNNEEVLFADEKLRCIDGQITPCNPVGDLWTDIGINNLHQEGGVSFRHGKKPEKLIHRVLEMATDPGDLVFDAFAGSGTTAAVAMKMGRTFIGIEKEQENISICRKRLQSVDNDEVNNVGYLYCEFN